MFKYSSFEEIHPIIIKQLKNDGEKGYDKFPIGTAIEYTNGMFHVQIKNGIDEMVQNRRAVNRIAEFYTAKVYWKSLSIKGDIK